MPWEREKKHKKIKGYWGRYPLPAHISMAERNKAIAELRDHGRRKETRLKKRILFFIGAHVLHWFVRIIYWLSKQNFSIHPETQKLIDDPKGQFIVAIWHNRLFYSVYSLRYKVAQYGHDILAIISESDDAEFIARCTQHCGAYASRGSSTRGGKKALKKILKYIKLHFHPLITPDGPVGPVYKVKEGVVAIAKLTNLPIVPIAYDTKQKWVFQSWDKFMIPKPRAEVFLDYGAPIHIGKDISTEKAMKIVESTMLEQIKALAQKI